MMEGDALAILVPTSAWLADVMKQRRESRNPKVEVGLSIGADVFDDGKGVRQDVLVAVNGILFQPHRG